MFDEVGSTEVELPLAYYIFHGWGFEQGGGAAWQSHTEYRRQRNNPRGNRTFFSLVLRKDELSIALSQDLHKNREQLFELSSPMASFNNDLFENQQCELEQTKITLRQKADMQRDLISKKSRIVNNLPEMKYTIQLASGKEHLAGLTRFKYQKMVNKIISKYRNNTSLHLRSDKYVAHMPLRGKILASPIIYFAPKAGIRTYDTTK